MRCVGSIEVAFRNAIEDREIAIWVFFCGRFSALNQPIACERKKDGTDRSSTRYGAELKDARRATLMLGPAKAPIALKALRAKRALRLSGALSARIAPEFT